MKKIKKAYYSEPNFFNNFEYCLWYSYRHDNIIVEKVRRL